MPTASTIGLTQSDLRRLDRLAREAGRSPRTMLRHVLRDGFDYTEDFVKKVNEGLDDVAAGRTVAHDEAIAHAQAAVARHAGKPKKAA